MPSSKNPGRRRLRLSLDNWTPIDWPEDVFPATGTPELMAELAALQPLTPQMQLLHVQHCSLCGCTTRPGEVVLRNHTPPRCGLTLCRRCGLAVELHFGRISTADALAMPTHGNP